MRPVCRGAAGLGPYSIPASHFPQSLLTVATGAEWASGSTRVCHLPLLCFLSSQFFSPAVNMQQHFDGKKNPSVHSFYMHHCYERVCVCVFIKAPPSPHFLE